MALPDLFAKVNECLITGLELDRYVYAICKNWNNYKLDVDIVANNQKNEKKDDKPKNKKRFLDNPYALYNVYNQRF